MQTTLKDGSIKNLEWELREIDKHGDSIDPQFCDRKEAQSGFKEWIPNGEAVAIVMERHTTWTDSAGGFIDETYEAKATKGEVTALQLGGWINN